MKTNILFLFGILLASISALIILNANVYASGESYTWEEPSIIIGSGGAYEVTIVDGNSGIGTLVFERVGDSASYTSEEVEYRTSNPNSPSGAGSSCTTTLTLNVSSNGNSANLIANNTECQPGLDAEISSIGNPGNKATDLPEVVSNEETTETTTCAIDGTGWIICTVARTMASMMDGIYNLLELFLAVQPLNADISDDSNTLYKSWSLVRNIANVAFVIAFMIIILSQVTSMGISNYGIKKMLPRLVVSAILVNVSYWIAALAVDLSNILGVGVADALIAIRNNLGEVTIDIPAWEQVLGILLSAGTLVVVGSGGATAIGAATVTAAGGASALGMAVLWIALPMLLAAILAVLVAVTVLAARQALIIILIIVSPLAFVAFLLPNTQKFFDLWRKSLTTMLILYPLLSLVFAGSQLASLIILGSIRNVQGAPIGHIVVLAMFVQVAPLILTPMLVKFSGGLIGQFAGVVNNKNRGIIDRSKKIRARKNALLGKQMLNAPARRYKSGPLQGRRTTGGVIQGLMRRSEYGRRSDELNTKAEDAYTEADWQENVAQDSALQASNERLLSNNDRAKSAQHIQQSNYVASLNEQGEALYTAAGIDPKGSSRVLAAAISAEKKEIADAIKNIEVSADIEAGDVAEIGKRFQDAVTGGDSVSARAYQNMLLTSGSPGINQFGASLDALENGGKTPLTGEVSEDLRANILDNHPGVKASNAAITKWASDMAGKDASNKPIRDKSFSNLTKDAGTWSGLTDAEFASQKPVAQEAAIASGVITPERAKNIQNSQVFSNMSAKIQDDIRKIASTSVSTSGQTPTSQNYSGVPSGVQEQILTVDHNATRPYASAPGQAPTTGGYFAGHTKETIQNLGPSNINVTINAAGGAANLTDADIAKVINATQSVSGAQDIHNALRAEREYRKTNIRPR